MEGFLYRSLDALYHGAVASTTGGQEIKHHRFPLTEFLEITFQSSLLSTCLMYCSRHVSCPFAKYVCSATVSSLYGYHLDITTFSILHLLPQHYTSNLPYNRVSLAVSLAVRLIVSLVIDPPLSLSTSISHGLQLIIRTIFHIKLKAVLTSRIRMQLSIRGQSDGLGQRFQRR